MARGETVALVGESGSGKSLTALAVLRLLPPGAGDGAGAAGRHGHDGRPARPAAGRARRHAGMVFQEPMTSLNPLHRIGRQVGEAMALHGRRPTRAAVVALLDSCGFPDAVRRLDALPHQLSGGQRQRVMIAMALANDPALLIADEPTTALDVTIQAQILDLLAAQKAKRGLALLLISHDLGVVRRYADRVCVMKDGCIVEQGDAATVFANPTHPYTRMLVDVGAAGPPEPAARRRTGADGRRRTSASTSPPAAGCCAGPPPRCGRWTTCRSPSGPARRSAWWAKAARASPRWAWPCCG